MVPWYPLNNRILFVWKCITNLPEGMWKIWQGPGFPHMLHAYLFRRMQTMPSDSCHRGPRDAPVLAFSTLDSLHCPLSYLFISSSDSVYPEGRDRVLHIINDYFGINWFSTSREKKHYEVLPLWAGTVIALYLQESIWGIEILPPQDHTVSGGKGSKTGM